MQLVSASQISKFRECERAWGWRYLAKLPDPSGPAASLGTECDDTQLQPYLRDDRPIDYSRESGYIVQPGLAYLPPPKAEGIELQKHFVVPSPTWVDGNHVGFGFQGYLDLWVPDARVMPDVAFDTRQIPEGRALPDGSLPPVVGDFKTTSNWKYQKTAADLKTDVQAQLYATWAMYFTGARVVDLVWVYFGTKGPRKAKRSHLRVHASHVAEQFSAINETALRMYELRKTVTNPLELTPNTDACEKYNGCPYRANCNLSPGDIIDAQAAQYARRQEPITMSNTNQALDTMSVLRRLRAQKAGVTPTEAKPSVMGCAPEDVPAPTEIPATFLGINPPESALPPAPPVGSVPVPAAAPVVDAAPAPAAAPVKRGPGRPRKVPLVSVSAPVLAPPPTVDELVAADVEVPTSALEPITFPSSEAAPAPEPAAPIPVQLVAGEWLGTNESVTVTWAEETFCPIAYNPFKVGPFSATGSARPGETTTQAAKRLYVELTQFAETARAEKAKSFKDTLERLGGGR